MPGEDVCELSILFTDDAEIQKLNSAYRFKNKPTDVLSFSLLEGDDTGVPTTSLGDIAVSLETAEKQAPEYGNSFPEEILRLLIHGVLHLLGYDHENVSEAEVRRMQEKEDELFEKYSKEVATFLDSL